MAGTTRATPAAVLEMRVCLVFVPEVFGKAVLHVGWGRQLDTTVKTSAGLSCLYPIRNRQRTKTDQIASYPRDMRARLA